MQDVQSKLLQRCIRDLGILGCMFAIIDADGQRHGTLEIKKIKQPKQPRRKLAFPFGAVSKYNEQFIKDLKVGDVSQIPINEFGHLRIQACVSGWFCRTHGVGSHTSTYNKEKNILEVMRLL
jgi:hypothetical protein